VGVGLALSIDRLDEKLTAAGARVPVYLFTIALTVHVCYLCQYARSPFFWVPELDSLYDDLAARAITAGHPGHEAFFRAPLYSYFLAAIYRVFGHSFWAARLTQAAVGSASVVLLYRLGASLFRPSVAVVAAASMALYGPLVFADGELHTTVLEVFLDLAFLNLALVAGNGAPKTAYAAMWGLRLGRKHVRLPSEGRPSGCFTTLWATPTPGEDHLSPAAPLPSRESGVGMLRWLAAGIIFGLSAITRPTILATIPVVLWWIVGDVVTHPGSFPPPGTTPETGGASVNITPAGCPAASRLGRVGTRWLAVTCSAAFLLGAVLFPVLVTVRNYYVSGDPVFIASQGGINLFLGNRHGVDGFTPSTPLRYRFEGEYQDSVALYGIAAADEAVGRRLSASQAQAYWVHRSLGWWKDDPSAAIKLTLKKCVLVWTHREIRNNTAYAFARKELTPFLAVCAVGFWIAGPLGLLGMALGWFPRPRMSDPSDLSDLSDAPVRQPECSYVRRIAVFIAVYLASFVPFFIADRYRLPVVPLLLLLSGYAVAWMTERVGRRHWTRLAAAAALLVPCALLVNVDWYRTETPAVWALDYWSAGNRCVVLGRYADAETWFRKGVRLDPSNGDIWNGLGEALYDEGRPAVAAACFYRSALAGPDVSRAAYNEALCAEQLGDSRSARTLLMTAVRIDPTYSPALRELHDLQR
jgi:tetratricopeptide (TPR) repeat protein